MTIIDLDDFRARLENRPPMGSGMALRLSGIDELDVIASPIIETSHIDGWAAIIEKIYAVERESMESGEGRPKYLRLGVFCIGVLIHDLGGQPLMLKLFEAFTRGHSGGDYGRRHSFLDHAWDGVRGDWVA